MSIAHAETAAGAVANPKSIGFFLRLAEEMKTSRTR
jgi:hypothetical protein